MRTQRAVSNQQSAMTYNKPMEWEMIATELLGVLPQFIKDKAASPFSTELLRIAPFSLRLLEEKGRR